MITDPITARVERLLIESAEVFVPFEQVYDTLQREGLLAHFDAAALLDLPARQLAFPGTRRLFASGFSRR